MSVFEGSSSGCSSGGISVVVAFRLDSAGAELLDVVASEVGFARVVVPVEGGLVAFSGATFVVVLGSVGSVVVARAPLSPKNGVVVVAAVALVVGSVLSEVELSGAPVGRCLRSIASSVIGLQPS